MRGQVRTAERLVVIAKELDHKELLECFFALGLKARATQ